jgi:predicted transcriptional regulator
MNRLLERRLLERKRRGKAFVYRARYDESELVARSLRELAGASADARTPALLNLMRGSTRTIWTSWPGTPTA